MAGHLYKLSAAGSISHWSAIGRVTIRAGQLEQMLKMLIKSNEGITLAEARYATDHMTVREIRERIRKLAKQKNLGESVLTRLDCLLNRSWHVSDQRNDLIHRMWAEDPDGTPITVGRGSSIDPPPTVPELRALEEEIAAIIGEINEARKEGFLAKELHKSNDRKRGHSKH